MVTIRRSTALVIAFLLLAQIIQSPHANAGNVLAQAQPELGGLASFGLQPGLIASDPGFRLVGCEVNICFEPENRRLSADLMMDIEVTADRLRDTHNWVVWPAELVTGATVDGVPVALRKGIPGMEEGSRDFLFVLLSSAMPGATRGSRARLTVSARGDIPSDEEAVKYGTFADIQGLVRALCALSPLDREWILRASVPADWSAIAAGNPLEEGRAEGAAVVTAGRRVFSWLMPVSRKGANLLVAAGPYSRIRLPVPGDCGLWLLPQDMPSSASLASRVSEVVTLATERVCGTVGLDPLGRLEIVKASRPGNNVSGKGPEGIILVEYGRGQPYKPDLFLRNLSHEVVHQWFPGRAEIDFRNGAWLVEGMATYFDSFFVRDEWPPDSYFMGLKGGEWPAYSINEVSAGMATMPSQVKQKILYLKSAWVIHMLRTKMGDEAFFRTLRRFYGSRTEDLVGTTEFLAMAEEESGLDLGPFLDQWLDEPTVPSITFEGVRVSQTRDGWRISGSVTNACPMHLPPVAVCVMSDLTKLQTVRVELPTPDGSLAGQKASFEVIAPSLLSRLVLDPDCDVLNASLSGHDVMLLRLWISQPGVLGTLAVLAAALFAGARRIVARRRWRRHATGEVP